MSCLRQNLNKTYILPDERFEEYHHNSDEVFRVDDVEHLEVRLASEGKGGG